MVAEKRTSLGGGGIGGNKLVNSNETGSNNKRNNISINKNNC